MRVQTQRNLLRAATAAAVLCTAGVIFLPSASAIGASVPSQIAPVSVIAIVGPIQTIR